nr:hypothetical protein [Tanacetum cinerariifolium]
DDDENIKWVDTDEEEEKNDDDDDKTIDLEKTNDEEIDDEFVHCEKYVQDDDVSVHGSDNYDLVRLVKPLVLAYLALCVRFYVQDPKEVPIDEEPLEELNEEG